MYRLVNRCLIVADLANTKQLVPLMTVGLTAALGFMMIRNRFLGNLVLCSSWIVYNVASMARELGPSMTLPLVSNVGTVLDMVSAKGQPYGVTMLMIFPGRWTLSIDASRGSILWRPCAVNPPGVIRLQRCVASRMLRNLLEVRVWVPLPLTRTRLSAAEWRLVTTLRNCKTTWVCLPGAYRVYCPRV